MISSDTKAVLLADAVMFLLALLLGVWKYSQIATTEEHKAHIYVDIAHRAALLYSFALLLIATFVELSGFSELVNLLAAGMMTFYFFTAVVTYSLHGWRNDFRRGFRRAYCPAERMAELRCKPGDSFSLPGSGRAGR